MSDYRPDWQEYFIGLAFIVSARSRDAETKHGAVITDKNNIIIGTGYNSFIRGIDDTIFPNTRPEKYPFFIHSEENALLNCKVPPRELNGGAVMYVTGTPCNNCMQRMIQAGITEIYAAERQGTKLESPETKKIFNILLDQSKIKFNYVKPNLDWIINTLKGINFNSENTNG